MCVGNLTKEDGKQTLCFCMTIHIPYNRTAICYLEDDEAFSQEPMGIISPDAISDPKSQLHEVDITNSSSSPLPLSDSEQTEHQAVGGSSNGDIVDQGPSQASAVNTEVLGT